MPPKGAEPYLPHENAGGWGGIGTAGYEEIWQEGRCLSEVSIWGWQTGLMYSLPCSMPPGATGRYM